MYFLLECQVIKRANGVQYGLAAVVWTENVSRTHRVSKRLQVKEREFWVTQFGIAVHRMSSLASELSSWFPSVDHCAVEN